MFSDYLQFASGALVAAVIVGLAWLAANERQKRQDEHAQRQKVEELLTSVQAQLVAIDRAKNPLYREAIEDQQAQKLKAAADVATGVEFMVQAIRILNPELLKKGKRS